MTGLLSQYSNKVAERIEWAFNELNLPMPDEVEFREGVSANIVYVNPLGLTLRIQNTPLIRHKHIARALGAMKLAKGWRLDIIQGGELVKNYEDIKKIEEQFQRDGIQTHETKIGNVLALKRATKKFPDGFPIDFDPHKIIFDPQKTRKFKKCRDSSIYRLSPLETEKPDIQDEYCNDLRLKFEAASCKDRDGLDKTLLNEFYSACYEATQEGRLSAPWINFSETNMGNLLIWAYGKYYQDATLRHNSFIAQLVSSTPS